MCKYTCGVCFSFVDVYAPIFLSLSMLQHDWFFPYLQGTIGLYVLLFLFESLPSTVVFCGLVSQLVHLSILRTFPYFFLTSLPFILGVGEYRRYKLMKYWRIEEF